MKERGTPYGNYSDAIPMEKLIRLTHEKMAAHIDYTDEHIREYAEHIIEAELCPCASSSKYIVDVLVVEVLHDVNR